MARDKVELEEEDGWCRAVGSLFVGPEDWLGGLPRDLKRDMHLEAITEGLALAADEEGKVLEWNPPDFYGGALSDVLRCPGDKKSWKLKFDRFGSMVLLDVMHRLVGAGYLADGPSCAYRLCLPTTPSPAPPLRSLSIVRA